MAGGESPPAADPSVVVWDPLVRLFHWSVVAACALNLFVLEGGSKAHEIIGYLAATVLAIRVLWGFVGTRYARFSDFVPSPSQLARYLALLATGREPRMLGHNPAGAVAMLALMLLLAGTCLTGSMLGLDAFWGAEWLEQLHEVLAYAILVLALAHAAAALVESYRHSENLVWAMITGRKRP